MEFYQVRLTKLYKPASKPSKTDPIMVENRLKRMIYGYCKTDVNALTAKACCNYITPKQLQVVIFRRRMKL